MGMEVICGKALEIMTYLLVAPPCPSLILEDRNEE